MSSNTVPAGADTPACYRVDDLLVDLGQRCVTRGATTLAVTGLSFDLLLVLMRAAPKLVPVEELMERIWPGLVVGADAVSQRVKVLRQALGDDAEKPRYIASMRGYGYRLLAAVEPLQLPGPGEVTPSLGGAEAGTESATDRSRPPMPGHVTVQSSHRWRIAALIALLLLGVALVGPRLWRAPAIVTSTAVAPSGSVAVLPFANLTGDTTKDYLGDGMAEELINTLGKVPGLKVPARTSSFAYKGRGTDVRQIAKDLGVGVILEGGIRSAGERIRVTAQLIDAQTGFQLWTESYDRRFTDLFKLQDDLAITIVQALQVNLHGAPAESVAQAPPTQDVEAYNLYLQGFALVAQPTGSNLDRAMGFFRQAIALDPKFARPYAGLASVYMQGNFLGLTVQAESEAEQAARQALTLDPDNGEALLAMAGINGLRGQFLAEAMYDRRAERQAAKDGFLRFVISAHQYVFGHEREALEGARKGYVLAPANQTVVAGFALFQSLQGHYEEALQYAEVAVDLGFDKNGIWPVYWREAMRGHRYTEATKISLTGLGLQNSKSDPAAELIESSYAALVDPAKRMAAIARAHAYTQQIATGARRGSPVACLASSIAYVLLKVPDVASDLAEHCLDKTSMGGNTAYFLYSPELAAWRAEPRFQVFASRIGLMDYWQKYGPPDDCDLKAGKLTCH
jgi:TolB-like protein/DNA-binding winged helix-turn-helix (wHTH) protein